jgi:uncharacterized protein (DUF433 family)
VAILDWSQCPAVETIPGKVSGAWLFKGTRTPVAVVFENLEDGMTLDEVIEQFPVSREQVKAVLEFAEHGASTHRLPRADARSSRQRNAQRRRRRPDGPCRGGGPGTR